MQVLDGSAEGKIKTATERLGLLSAISALSETGPRTAGPCADKAASFLCSYIKYAVFST